VALAARAAAPVADSAAVALVAAVLAALAARAADPVVGQAVDASTETMADRAACLGQVKVGSCCVKARSLRRSRSQI
jgi:hypothetical protein